MFDAFELGAGYTVSDLSIFFRSVFAALVSLWTAWVAYKQFFLMTGNKLGLGDWGKNMIMLLMIWSFLMILIVV